MHGGLAGLISYRGSAISDVHICVLSQGQHVAGGHGENGLPRNTSNASKGRTGTERCGRSACEIGLLRSK